MRSGSGPESPSPSDGSANPVPPAKAALADSAAGDAPAPVAQVDGTALASVAPADGAAPTGALPETAAQAAELQRRTEEKKQVDGINERVRAFAYAKDYNDKINEIWERVNLTAAEIAAAKAARSASFDLEASEDLPLEQSPSGVYKRGFAAVNYLADKALGAGYSNLIWQKNDNGGGSLSIERRPPTASDLINGMEFMSKQGAGKITLDYDSPENVDAAAQRNIAKLLKAAMDKDPPVQVNFGPNITAAIANNPDLKSLQAETVAKYEAHWEAEKAKKQASDVESVRQDLAQEPNVDVSERGLARALEGLGPDESAIDAALPSEAQEAVAEARNYIETGIVDAGVKGELNRMVNEFATNVADPDKADTAIMDLQKELRSAAKNNFISVDQESTIVDAALKAYEAVNDQRSTPGSPAI